MTAQASPEQMERAQALVKQFYPEMRDSYSGRRLQIALTAILQSDQQQAEKDARIVELGADNTYLAKTLIEMGEKVTLYVDEFEDEGDRIYFGSTNHAEYLRDLCQTVFEERVFRNDRFEKPAKGRDLYAEMRALRDDLATAQSRQAELLRHAEAMAGALERCAEIVKRNNWRQNEKVDDVTLIANQHATAFREFKGGRSDGPEPGSADWLKQSPNFHPGDLA